MRAEQRRRIRIRLIKAKIWVTRGGKTQGGIPYTNVKQAENQTGSTESP